jgi:hypothetical protein
MASGSPELDAGEAAIRSRLHTAENRLLDLEKRIKHPAGRLKLNLTVRGFA